MNVSHLVQIKIILTRGVCSIIYYIFYFDGAILFIFVEEKTSAYLFYELYLIESFCYHQQSIILREFFRISFPFTF